MHAETIITVRYTSGTYVARVKGCKQTASCVYDAGLAAKALARKLGLDADRLVKKVDGRDYLEFSAAPTAPAERICVTMQRPVSQCGCPDCGRSLIDCQGWTMPREVKP